MTGQAGRQVRIGGTAMAIGAIVACASCSSPSGSTDADAAAQDAASEMGGSDAAPSVLPPWCTAGANGTIGLSYSIAGGPVIQACLSFEQDAQASYSDFGGTCTFRQTSVLAAGMASTTATVLATVDVFAATGPYTMTVTIADATDCRVGQNCSGMGSCAFHVVQAGASGDTVSATLDAPCTLALQVVSPYDGGSATGGSVQLLSMGIVGPLQIVTVTNPADAAVDGCR